jgi:hypothetical protein
VLTIRTDLSERKKDWRWAFLAHYARTLNVSESCERARVSRSTVYRHRARFAGFRRRWAELREGAVDALEAEARRRALSADDRASHTLLMFLLKAHRPETYGDRGRAPPPPEADAPPVLTAEVVATLSTDELNALESIARKLTGEP